MASNTKQDEECAELNATIKTRIGVSKIHGVGIIALTAIRKGERCYCVPVQSLNRWYSVSWGSLGKLFPHVEKLIKDQWPSIVNGSHFLSPNYTSWQILYMNHSSDPEKINFDNMTDTATQDISEGAELFENYKTMVNWKKVWPEDKNPWINN